MCFQTAQLQEIYQILIIITLVFHIQKYLFLHRLPSSFGDDHLGAQIVELVPQVLRLQVARDVPQLLARTNFLQEGVPVRRSSPARVRLGG